MKTFLLLGDSIRQNYQQYVKSKLAGKANVLYPNDNGRFCQYTLRYIYDWVRSLTDGHGEIVDVVHFNCGLWDILRLSNEDCPFTSEEQYRELLLRIYQRGCYACPNAKFIFALTTSVIEPGFTPGLAVGQRLNADIERYNEIAVKLFEPLGVGIDDLWTISRKLPQEAHSDDVHFETELGISVLGEKVIHDLIKSCNIV